MELRENLDYVSNNLSLVSGNVHDLLSDSQLEIFVVINFVFFSGGICLCGAVANCMNIAVFLKQGFSNTINISFFALSISDLCCVLALLWQTIGLNPLVLKAGAMWVPLDFVYLTASWPHNISCRITSYITIFVTLERCLCIALPLKVKNIFTPAKTTVAIVVIFIVNILSLVPEYATSYLAWTYFPESNRTLLAINFKPGREKVVGLVYIMNCTTGIMSFVGIVVITAFLVFKLKEASQWRQEVTSGSQQHGTVSSRDKKTVKIVAALACILICCYTPGMIISMTTFAVPEFDIGRKYSNTFLSMWSIGGMFQALNSSVNIILYYKMSSKYRDTFHQLVVVCRCHKHSFGHVGTSRRLME